MRGSVFETAIGHAAVGWTLRGIARFVLPRPCREEARASLGPHETAPLTGSLAGLLEETRRWARGELASFERFPLDIATTAFFQEVYALARTIPRGETRTYGELAVSLGRPGAARAVGAAMARNPVPLLVPCHRVLGKGGRLCGFTAPGGVDFKARLLELERVA